jgi:hypothetical protein
MFYRGIKPLLQISPPASTKLFDGPAILARVRGLKISLRLTLWLLCCAALTLRAVDNAGAPATPGGEEYPKVGFDRLASYTFIPPEADTATPNAPPPSGANQIPDKIKALDRQKVAVTGFMLPVKMDGGLVKEFLLVKDPMMCCYGIMPKINEWVVVKMVGKGVKPLMDIPITFDGKLRVGEMYENGYLTGVYLLEGDRMAETKG